MKKGMWLALLAALMLFVLSPDSASAAAPGSVKQNGVLSVSIRANPSLSIYRGIRRR